MRVQEENRIPRGEVKFLDFGRNT